VITVVRLMMCETLIVLYKTDQSQMMKVWPFLQAVILLMSGTVICIDV